METNKFSAKARTMTPAQLRNARHDAEIFLESWGNRKSPFTEQLRAEIEAYSTEEKMRATGKVKVTMGNFAF